MSDGISHGFIFFGVTTQTRFRMIGLFVHQIRQIVHRKIAAVFRIPANFNTDISTSLVFLLFLLVFSDFPYRLFSEGNFFV